MSTPTATDTLTESLRAAILGDYLGFQLDHDPGRLAEALRVTVEQVAPGVLADSHPLGQDGAEYNPRRRRIRLSATDDPERARWLLAHECGHVLQIGNVLATPGGFEEEGPCNFFARSFLVGAAPEIRNLPAAPVVIAASLHSVARMMEPLGSAHYIEDAASIAQYGVRERVLQVRDILPLGITATDFTRAANTLYDEAVTYLQRHKDEQVAYEVDVVGLKHVVSGAYVFQVGDKIRLKYDGVVQDADGRRAFKTVDNSDLYIMAATRTFDATGASTWKLTVSTVARELPNDGNITEKFMSDLQAVKAAPLPYVLFGDNVARVSEAGIQLHATLFSADPDSPKRVMWTSADWTLVYSDVYGGLQNYLTSPPADPDLSFVSLRALFDFTESGGFPLIGLASMGAWDVNAALWDNVAAVRSSSDTDSSGSPVFAVHRNTGGDGGDVDGFAVYRDSAGNWRVTVKRNGVAVELGGGDGSELTIATGAIAITTGYHRVDTQSDGASDDLDTISGGTTGQILIIRAENSARSVVAKDGTGNLKLAGDCTLDNAEDTLMLIYDGSNWLEIARSNNGA